MKATIAAIISAAAITPAIGQAAAPATPKETTKIEATQAKVDKQVAKDRAKVAKAQKKAKKVKKVQKDKVAPKAS